MTDGYAVFPDRALAWIFAMLAAAIIMRGIDEYAFVRSGRQVLFAPLIG